MIVAINWINKAKRITLRSLLDKILRILGMKKYNFGILAFGSLIDDPGTELENLIVRKIANVETPFRVEYGRKSSERGNAPTLIPVEEGGSTVMATLLIISDKVEQGEIMNMLYRRELNKVGQDKKYFQRSNLTPNQLVIQQHKMIKWVRIALTANFGCNLEDVTAEHLACLAIESFNSYEVDAGRDGIAYLGNNIKNGIITPLTEEYKNQILDRMDARSLEEILNNNTP